MKSVDQMVVGIINYMRLDDYTAANLAFQIAKEVGCKTKGLSGSNARAATVESVQRFVDDSDITLIFQGQPTDGITALTAVRQRNVSKPICFVYEGQPPNIPVGDNFYAIPVTDIEGFLSSILDAPEESRAK